MNPPEATVQTPSPPAHPPTPSGNAADSRVRPLTAARGLILWAAAAACGTLSAWITLIDRHDGGFVLSATDDGRPVASLPMELVGAVAAITAIGFLATLVSIWTDPRARGALTWAFGWLRKHPLWAALLGISALLGSVDVYELLYDAYNQKRGLRIWILREDLQTWLAFAASIMGALGLSAILGRGPRIANLAARLAASLREHTVAWRTLAVLVPTTLAALMAKGALDALPHFSDSATYLMQGRILFSGRLWLPTPEHIDLFQHSLFFVEADGRFFGKYPIGWPAILGAFDALGIGYAANAALVGLAALLTGLLAAEVSSKRTSVIAAVLFGLSPWVWLSGANFASHAASVCAVTAFLWLFLRAVRTHHPAAVFGAGLAIGAALLVRPFDAAVFALPAIPVVLWQQARHPARWIWRGSLMAVAGMIGVAVYMFVNANTTGEPLTSAYALESRWDSDWNPSPASMLSRFAFQWCELNGRTPGWGIGSLTIAIAGAAAVGARWRRSGLWLILAATALFFTLSSAFVFTNVWWGSRWLLPAVPLLAILAAELLDQALTHATAKPDPTAPIASSAPAIALPVAPTIAATIAPRAAAAQFALCLLASGLIVGLGARYAGLYAQHRLTPPHLVSAGLSERVNAQGITNAIVAMPPQGGRAPLDARAGMVLMGVPLDTNPIIYVRAIKGWRHKAAACFPGRLLYEVVPDDSDPQGFQIHPHKGDK